MLKIQKDIRSSPSFPYFISTSTPTDENVEISGPNSAKGSYGEACQMLVANRQALQQGHKNTQDVSRGTYSKLRENGINFVDSLHVTDSQNSSLTNSSIFGFYVSLADNTPRFIHITKHIPIYFTYTSDGKFLAEDIDGMRFFASKDPKFRASTHVQGQGRSLTLKMLYHTG